MNYKIEGYKDFDLKKELLNYNEIEDNTCLLTGEPLIYNYITLECNHKFNYSSLFEQLKSIKLIKNYFNKRKLNIDEIMCPYCRNIQTSIMPYIEIEEKKRIRGINHPQKYCMNFKKCEKCNENAFESNNGILCSKHYKEEERKKSIVKYKDEIQIYKTKKCSELKEILKEQNKKISGNKLELILRIIDF